MEIGKISFVEDLRDAWKHEEKDFTPWLAENISLLGESLGLDLEVLAVEHDVGAFSLDILAKDTSNGNIVAIENQLEVTDHNHLGQIMTYASGVDAKSIVWISKEVREEHRKAFDWLNQITSEELEFFAVEIQLVKVNDSLPAPLFKIKASPNDWSKEQRSKLKTSESITKREEGYHEFFTKLLNTIHKEMPRFTNAKKVSFDSWKTFPTGTSGILYSVAFRTGKRLSCEIYFDSGNKEINKQRFDLLLSNRDSIEAVLGELSWERLDNKKASRVAIYTDYLNENEMLSWAIYQLKSFKECFKEYLILM